MCLVLVLEPLVTSQSPDVCLYVCICMTSLYYCEARLLQKIGNSAQHGPFNISSDWFELTLWQLSVFLKLKGHF